MELLTAMASAEYWDLLLERRKALLTVMVWAEHLEEMTES